jgi:peptidoglycan lytic transglycosylase D
LKREFALAGLPQDLIWLAMVESQFHPRVVSHAGAAGMWQFMRATGRRYNLRIDSYVDERFNWRKETRAAVSYLSDLRDIFDGEWPLAISSYNMGEGGMGRAIAANGGGNDIWDLIQTSHMPRETRKFYPKLLASVIVARNPDQYGFKLNKRDPEPCAFAPIKGCYSLSALDKACGLPSGTLKRLNADLIKGVTPPSGEFQLVMPKSAAGKLKAALKKVPKYRPDLHVVRRGETLGGIAKRYGVSVRELQSVNKIRSPRSLQVGKRLVIPGAYSPSGSSSSASSTKVTSGATTYKVKRGDALSKIAASHGVRMSDLQQWNGMGRRTTIKVGQVLRVASPGTKTASAPTATAAAKPSGGGNKTTHVVKAGEFPSKIAKMHGVGLEDFLKWNNLTTRSMIQVGDKLVVIGGKKIAAAVHTQSPATGDDVKVCKVMSGDSSWLIASREGIDLDDFLKWNGLTKKSVLKVGQKVVIRKPTGGSTSKSEAKKISHTVGKGQCAGSIAQRYGVTLSDLLKWNGLSRKSVLKVGQKLVIYKAS